MTHNLVEPLWVCVFDVAGKNFIYGEIAQRLSFQNQIDQLYSTSIKD